MGENKVYSHVRKSVFVVISKNQCKKVYKCVWEKVVCVVINTVYVGITVVCVVINTMYMGITVVCVRIK